MPWRRRHSRSSWAGAALAGLLLLCWSTSEAAGRKSALIMGISQYADIKIQDLKYADADARELAKILTNWGGYSRDCLILLTNKQATGKGIRRAFQKLIKLCKNPDGTLGEVLVHYSGHAVLATSVGGDFIKRGVKAREFIAPFDADLSETYRLSDGSTANDTFLKKEWFASRIANLKSDSITIVLDACHSGMPDLDGMITENLGYRLSEIKPKFGDEPIQGLRTYSRRLGSASERRKRIVLIAATNERGVSAEFAKLEHGALSYAIISSLWSMRRKIPRYTRQNLYVDTLFQEINVAFQGTWVEGRRLAEFHLPQLFMVPKLSRNSVAFANITGSAVIGPALIAKRPEIIERPKVEEPKVEPLPVVAKPEVEKPAIKKWVIVEKPKGKFLIRTRPPGAIVHIDGNRMDQRSNAEFELPPGKYIVTVQLPSSTYRHVLQVDIVADRMTEEIVDFMGTLTVAAFLKDRPDRPGPRISVYLNNQSLGKTSSVSRQLLAGTHRLRVEYKGVTRDKEVSIRPDSPLTVRYIIKRIRPPAADQDKRRLDVPF